MLKASSGRLVFCPVAVEKTFEGKLLTVVVTVLRGIIVGTSEEKLEQELSNMTEDNMTGIKSAFPFYPPVIEKCLSTNKTYS